ncbi:MAG: ATP-binding protein [Planctomycetes bacterium]|nr:ATP-binding protein [Planctomycetota bacterium]
MQRLVEQALQDWAAHPARLPLVLRGARQTGKSWLVAHFPGKDPADVATIDFERDPSLAACFASNDPAATLAVLEARLRRTIVPGRTLLFLDEIQAAPEVIGKLRWFAEELPALHVVAAGSLLDLALGDTARSAPVGRLTFGHLEPMTFAEFLLAAGEHRLLAAVDGASVAAPLPAPLHARAIELLREYPFVGGMPAAVARWVAGRSFVQVAALHRDLLQTMRDDFAKYRRGVDARRVAQVFDALGRLVGRKFQPVQVDRGAKSQALQQAFRMLCEARVATAVARTAANGIPLGAEVDARYQKVCLLDVGLLATASGLDPSAVLAAPGLRLVHEGALAEQLVGQELRAVRPFGEPPALFTWVREAKGANAEVDYVLQVGSRVVPVEVKAGAPGRLRSLHVMVVEKGLDVAVRVGPEPLQLREVSTALPRGPQRRFRLLSVPFYLVARLPALVREVAGQSVGPRS